MFENYCYNQNLVVKAIKIQKCFLTMACVGEQVLLGTYPASTFYVVWLSHEGKE